MYEKNKSEEECGRSECGLCGIPNPMNTHTRGKAIRGLAITNSPKYQKSMNELFGEKKAKQKIKCEYDRVKKIAIEKYDVNVKAKWEWKL